ncbi:MAG TPA: hypothetical protein VFG54_22300 [Prolixibacteraceae bacterium]|nr:hypothetical protein [Prolixibacteraceae bacterium]
MKEQKIQTSELTNPFSLLEKDQNISENIYADPQYEEKYRLYSIFTSDVVWTINTEGKVSYINPFVENCIGNDADNVIKNIVSKFLSPASVISCLIELEEIKPVVKSEYKMKPRKLFLETLMFEEKTRRLEITTSAIYDSMNNFVGFIGTCQEIT